MKKKLKTAVSTASQATISWLDIEEGDDGDGVDDAVVEFPVVFPFIVTIPAGQLEKGAGILPLTAVQLVPAQPCGMSIILGAEFASNTVALTPPKGAAVLHGQPLVQGCATFPPSNVKLEPTAGIVPELAVCVHSSTLSGAASSAAFVVRLVDELATTSAHGK